MSPKNRHIKSALVSQSEEITCFDIIKAVAAKFDHFCLLRPKKKVSFSDAVTVHELPSEPAGIFWIKDTDLVQLYQQKYQIFNDQESLEFQVLDMIAGAIEKSHIIYEELYRFIVRIDGYDLYLPQTKVEVDEKTTIDFPDPETFDQLQKNKEYFKATAKTLLNLLKPIYEINEHLFELMKNMDETTKIDPILFKRLNSEAVTMHFFVQDLTNKIQKCKMNLYSQYLHDIRIQINQFDFETMTFEFKMKTLELKMMTLKTEQQLLTIAIEPLTKVSVSMNKMLKAAMNIGFPKLHEATAKFCDLVKEALVRRPQ